MEFDDMQVIWNSESQEKLFAINETALYSYIKRRGKAVNRVLQRFELIMFGANLIVSIVLLVDGIQDNHQSYEYILPALYFAFSIYSLVRGFARRKEEVHFEQTMVGELDKAIWRIDYLIAQSRSILLWYLLPLIVVFSVLMLIDRNLIWAFGGTSSYGAAWILWWALGDQQMLFA